MVFLFFDQISGLSNVQHVAPALVLGTVAAHEIGHVLLKDNAHSPLGVMRASLTGTDWERAESGWLLFSPAEGDTMRGTISACR